MRVDVKMFFFSTLLLESVDQKTETAHPLHGRHHASNPGTVP